MSKRWEFILEVTSKEDPESSIIELLNRLGLVYTLDNI